jgi:hypothetical protein
MFGSSFNQNFGIPDQPSFPFQGQDPQGGLFGQNVPAPDTTNDAGGPPAAPAEGQPTSPGVPSLGSPSPLAGGPLAPGGAAPTPPKMTDPGQAAPAAGIGSPFGAPRL